MSTSSEKTTPTMDLSDLAILLTVLSKEAHNSQFYKRMSDESDNGYIQSLQKIIHLHVASIATKQQEYLAQSYPHLRELFPDLVLNESQP